MAIDPSIPLAVRVPTPENPVDLATKVQTLKNLGQAGQAQALENQLRQRELQKQDAISQALREAYYVEPDEYPSVPLPPTTAPATASPPPSPPDTALSDIGQAPDPAAMTRERAQVEADYADHRAGAPAPQSAVPATPPIAAAPAPAPKAPKAPATFNSAKFVNSLRAKGIDPSGFIKGWAAADKEVADAKDSQGKVDIQVKDALAQAAASPTVKSSDGHYDPEAIMGLLAHGAMEINSPNLKQAYQQYQRKLVSATDPAQRQALADQVGGMLEGGESAARLTAQARATTAATSVKAHQFTEDEKLVKDAAGRLAAARNQNEYTKEYDELPVKIARRFDPPASYNPATSPQRARQIGMSPAEQATDARAAANDLRVREYQQEQQRLERVRADLEKEKFAWQQTHNGQSPDEHLLEQYKLYLTEYHRQNPVKTDALGQILSGEEQPKYTPAKSYDEWLKMTGKEAAATLGKNGQPKADTKKAPQVGETYMVNGKRVKVTKVNPDGTVDVSSVP